MTKYTTAAEDKTGTISQKPSTSLDTATVSWNSQSQHYSRYCDYFMELTNQALQ